MYGPPEKLERQVFDGRFRVCTSRLRDVGPVLDGGFGVETGIGQDSEQEEDCGTMSAWQVESRLSKSRQGNVPQADYVGLPLLLDREVNVRISRRLLGLFLGDIVDRIVNERSQENAARSSTTR